MVFLAVTGLFVVMRRDGDDVVIVHRPGGEVRVGADDDPGVQFNEFCVSWMGFGAPSFGMFLRIGKDVCSRCGVRQG